MSSVFISYVREDYEVVKLLASILRKNGINVFTDKDDLMPGGRWKSALEQAIRNGSFFLSIYSKARQSRSKSYANEETVVAVEEIRARPINKPYFIPVKIDDCDIESRPIGGGETILDLQICDLTDWSVELRRLLKVLGVSDPVTDLGKPLAVGVASQVRFTGGAVVYDHIEGAAPFMQGIRFEIGGGWCQRTEDDQIMLYLEMIAPLAKLQTYNRMAGLNGVHAICHDIEVSVSKERPSRFSSEKDIQLPAGSILTDFGSGQDFALPMPLNMTTRMEAFGHIDGSSFVGKFKGWIEFASDFALPSVEMSGTVEAKFEVAT